MGKVEKTKKKKRNYLEKDHTILYYNENSKTKSTIIGLLRNGNFSDLLPVILNGIYYTFSNTCPFDSIFQLLCTTYADDHIYAAFIDSKIEEDVFFKSISRALRDGINVQTYKRRAKILKCIYENQTKGLTNNFTNINCASTSNFIIMKLFQNWPSYEQTTSCLGCSTIDTRYSSTLMANLPINNLDFLKDVVNQLLEPQQLDCTYCNLKTSSKQIILKQQLIIETVASFYSQTNKNNFDISVPLENIPTHLLINTGKRYNLRGIIAFIPPISSSPLAVGHYVSYNWREHNNTWERYDDTTRKEKIVRRSTIVNCQFVLYT